VPTFADGEVKAFVEKPPPGAAPTEWINAGTYVLEPSILQRIPAGLCVSIERETFPRLLEQRGRLFAMPSDAYWIDIGTPDQYLQVHADLLQGRLGPSPVPGAHQTAPGIWTQGDAAPPGLGPPALVGPDCVVETDARVSGSVLGARVRVGPGAVVGQSVLHDDVSVAAGARVHDSIIGNGAVIGADAEVADRSILGADAVLEAGGCLVRARRPTTPTPAVSP